MKRRFWTHEMEGAVAMVVATAALLAYGAMYEDIFALRGATVPAIALAVALVLALIDVAVRSAGLRQSTEASLSIAAILAGTAASIVFAYGIIYVGLIVTSTAAAFVCITVVRRRAQASVAAISIGVGIFIWVIFVYFGHAFMGRPWLF